MPGSLPLQEALTAVGDLLRAAGQTEAVVVVGGASLNLLGLVQRTTGDVDVIARAQADDTGQLQLTPPEPFPDPLRAAVETVARDFALPRDWMNAEVGQQWRGGLPPWLGKDITWRSFGALAVGLVGRKTLIALKLFAAADATAESVHAQDLVALEPTDEELESAAAWVISQDASLEFSRMVQEVMEYAKRRRG